MTSQYNIDKVTYGVSGWGNILSDTIYTATLGSSSDTTVTVPSAGALGAPGANVNKFIARIRVNGTKSVWFARNATAVVPAGSSFALASSELLIQAAGGDNGYYVLAGDVLHFISAAAADVSVAFYAIQSN
jgi:hypothetical protein